jgi:hypothetical protein
MLHLLGFLVFKHAFTNNILSESTVLQVASDFALLHYFVRGRFMVVGLLWLGIGQKRSERANRG